MAVKPITTLRTVYRDVRVTANGLLQVRRRSSAIVAFGLAQTMMDRYARQTWLWQALNLIFRQFRSLVNLKNVHHHSHTQVAPHLALTVARWSPQPGSLPASNTLIPVTQLVRSKAIETLANSYLINQEHRIYRLRERYQRITRSEQITVTHSHPMKYSAAENATPAHPGSAIIESLPRIFRRSKSLVNESEPRSRSSSEPQSSLKGVNLTTKLSPPAPAIDVNRLTDQVIQTIDQRILAQRERLGRF